MQFSTSGMHTTQQETDQFIKVNGYPVYALINITIKLQYKS